MSSSFVFVVLNQFIKTLILIVSRLQFRMISSIGQFEKLLNDTINAMVLK